MHTNGNAPHDLPWFDKTSQMLRKKEPTRTLRKARTLSTLLKARMLSTLESDLLGELEALERLFLPRDAAYYPFDLLWFRFDESLGWMRV